MKFFKPHLMNALLITCLAWLVASCQTISPVLDKPTPTSLPNPTATATSIPTSTPTETPQPPTAVLLAPPGADEALANRLQADLNDTVTGRGLRWQVRQSLTAEDLIPALRLVVALPPDPGLAALAATAPQTQFLAIGIPGVQATSNLTLLDTASSRPDRQGFVAGSVAAMLAPDWRVGMISLSDTVEGRSARTGFLNGVEYFCGLCRPLHPPYYEYPLYIELASTATSPEWQEAANYMVDHYAAVVYVYPGAGDEAMLTVLATAGIQIISSGEPPQAAQETWAVSLDTDPFPLILSHVEGLLDGSLPGGQSLGVPIQFTHINRTMLTPGKQRLADEILADLQADFIDTGVDLTTGEFRP